MSGPDILPPDHIRVVDQVIHVSFTDGSSGAVSPPLAPGWTVRRLYTGLSPLLVLELVHQPDGLQAVWLLDTELHLLGDHPSHLPEPYRGWMQQALVRIVGPAVHNLMMQGQPQRPPGVEGFFKLGTHTRQTLSEALQEQAGWLLPHPRESTAGQLPASLPYPGRRGVHILHREQLQQCLEPDFQSLLLEHLPQGNLLYPSPADGSLLPAQGCIAPDDFQFFYRFHDAAHELTFYVMATHHKTRLIGLYIPVLNLFITRDEHEAIHARPWLEKLSSTLAGHISVYGGLLFDYFNAALSGVCSILRGWPATHIGHQIWNELSGIDNYTALIPQSHQNVEWLVINGRQGAELFDPIDTLYPSLKGRVRRELDSYQAMIEHIYTTRRLATRVTHDYVTEPLRRRILDAALRSEHVKELYETMLQHGYRHAPVIGLGLRVENRTVANPTEFYSHILEHLCTAFPGALVVFDAHNCRSDAPDRMIGSHGEIFLPTPAVEIERSIVKTLRETYAGRDIIILDTLGAPVKKSLAWLAFADCFISIWGASLAKYRWVCNLPGLVVSNRLNLQSREDLHIYDSPTYMENPAPLMFLPEEYVTDDPAAPILIDHVLHRAHFANFHVNYPALTERVQRLVQTTLLERTNGPPLERIINTLNAHTPL